MIQTVASFSGFTVDDLEAAKQFYSQLLGCRLEDQMGGCRLGLPDGRTLWVYTKPDHKPAEYTMLNLVVEDIDTAVDELKAQGIELERYPRTLQDDKGVMRGKDNNMGPNIAWFKDPAGNILSIIEE